MRFGITAKVFIAMLVTSFFVVVAMGYAGLFSFNRDFLGYLREQDLKRMEITVPPLAAAYKEHKSWQFIRDEPLSWIELMRPTTDGFQPLGKFDSFPIADLTGANMRFTLLDERDRYVFGNPVSRSGSLRRAIIVDGSTVGWLEMLPFKEVTEQGDLRFQRGQLRASWTVGAFAFGFSSLIALWLARALAAPVRRLVPAIHALAEGNLDVRVSVSSNNDMGQLERDFNQLARTLEHNEQRRRAFVADISHELRTPLAVMRGELEALEDGIRPINQEAVSSLQSEVKSMSSLVTDLYELSLADIGASHYRLSRTDVRDVMTTAVSMFRDRLSKAGIELRLEPGDQPLIVNGDDDRLIQVFGNLLENSARYTDRGGRLEISCQRGATAVVIDVADTGPGVPAALIDKLFDRFYRVDSSRNRATGGAGLGLPICRSIIEAHEGSIVARPSRAGGLQIIIRLPLAGDP